MITLEIRRWFFCRQVRTILLNSEDDYPESCQVIALKKKISFAAPTSFFLLHFSKVPQDSVQFTRQAESSPQMFTCEVWIRSTLSRSHRKLAFGLRYSKDEEVHFAFIPHKQMYFLATAERIEPQSLMFFPSITYKSYTGGFPRSVCKPEEAGVLSIEHETRVASSQV